MELLRFTTAGSVDDGKSTLIGRLLYETSNVKQDILAAVSGESSQINLAYLTDGLRAEREQGITIDVAYKYFSSSGRAFIITDAPGHFQYTRNLISGASNVHLMIILVDAMSGITNQSRMHIQVASFLRVPQVVVAVNKMDLVEYKEDVFRGIYDEFMQDIRNLHIGHIDFIPISALLGDNISGRSDKMSWYKGPSMLKYLENLHQPMGGSETLRISVQCSREGIHFGKILSGTIRSGDNIVAHPGNTAAQVKEIFLRGILAGEAGPGNHIAFTLRGDVQLCRGDIITHPSSSPLCASEFTAELCWLDAVKTAVKDEMYLLRIGCQEVKGRISEIFSVMHPVNHEWQSLGGDVSVNQFAQVHFVTERIVAFDFFSVDRSAGRGILIDTVTNAVMAAFIITSGDVQDRTGA